MKNRRFPYGYEMQCGKIQICKSESIILAEIFNGYINGSNLKEISDNLTGKKVEYLPDECCWNKSRINRIIEDRRYLGDEIYPQLIQEEIFNEANSIKQIRRTTKKPEYSGDNRIDIRPKRVAAYCRVSTDKEQQEHSFETQKEMYTEMIMMKPNWQMAGIYAEM